jgi:septal ring factor EnvC (AmiA/AmiB activator)
MANQHQDLIAAVEALLKGSGPHLPCSDEHWGDDVGDQQWYDVSAALAAAKSAPARGDAVAAAEKERDGCCDDYQKEAARAVEAEKERDDLKQACADHLKNFANASEQYEELQAKLVAAEKRLDELEASGARAENT